MHRLSLEECLFIYLNAIYKICFFVNLCYIKYNKKLMKILKRISIQILKILFIKKNIFNQKSQHKFLLNIIF